MTKPLFANERYANNFFSYQDNRNIYSHVHTLTYPI
jgi:hypothetical protein